MLDILGEDPSLNDVGLEQWHQSVNQMTFEGIRISNYNWGGLSRIFTK